MTAVPSFPHYLVTLFLSKVIFFFLVFLIFFPTGRLSSWCRSQMDLEFLLWSSLRLPQSVPSLSSWFQFHIHFSPSNAFLTSCHLSSLVLSVVLGFFSVELSFFPPKQFSHVTFLFCLFLSVFHLMFCLHLIGRQFSYKETKLVPASSWKPLMTWQLSSSYKQSAQQPSVYLFNSKHFSLAIFLNEKWRMLTLEQAFYLIPKYSSQENVCLEYDSSSSRIAFYLRLCCHCFKVFPPVDK